MGIYNFIHNNDDDLYYYCPVNDCPCHQPDYYDSSRNNYNNVYFNNDNKYDDYNVVNNNYYNNKYNYNSSNSSPSTS